MTVALDRDEFIAGYLAEAHEHLQSSISHLLAVEVALKNNEPHHRLVHRCCAQAELARQVRFAEQASTANTTVLQNLLQTFIHQLRMRWWAVDRLEDGLVAANRQKTMCAPSMASRG